MGGLILTRITDWLLSKKYYHGSKRNFKTDKKILLASFKRFSLSLAMRNNFDLKPSILGLFYSAFWIDLLTTPLIILANVIYTLIFFYNFLNCHLSGINPHWNWVGTLILNLLTIIFLVRAISDAYKLSLRTNYRNHYLNLLFLDVLTLNLLCIIGSLIFVKSKSTVSQNSFGTDKIEKKISNSPLLKDFFKTVFKIETLMFLLNLILFVGALCTGYFVRDNSFKFACVAIILWNMIFFYCWTLPRIFGLTIGWKMFTNLLGNQNYYFLLSTIRFLSFFWGYYYSVVFINSMEFNEVFKAFLIQNF